MDIQLDETGLYRRWYGVQNFQVSSRAVHLFRTSINCCRGSNIHDRQDFTILMWLRIWQRKYLPIFSTQAYSNHVHWSFFRSWGEYNDFAIWMIVTHILYLSLSLFLITIITFHHNVFRGLTWVSKIIVLDWNQRWARIWQHKHWISNKIWKLRNYQN